MKSEAIVVTARGIGDGTATTREEVAQIDYARHGNLAEMEARILSDADEITRIRALYNDDSRKATQPNKGE